MRLVSARWVLPMVTPPLPDGAVLLADDDATIAAVGARADLRRAHPAVPETRAEGALLPGLVNAHAHLELSALAGQVPGGDGVVAWTRRLMGRVAEVNDDQRHRAAEEAARGAAAHGTAAIGDVGNGVAGWRALGRAGLSGVFFHELVGSREARTGDALGDATRERAAVAQRDRPAEVAAVPAPHAPYSVGPDLLRRIFAAAAAAGRASCIHLAEDPDEIRLLRDGTGAWPPILDALGVPPGSRTPRARPVEYMEQVGAFTGPHPPLLVHMVHADDDDRRRARHAGATVVLCPRSNVHIGGQLPDVAAFVREGVALAIGTDSLASAPDLSPWAEIATLAGRFPDIAPRVWLHAATAGGAAALGLARLGALAPGMRPGLLDVVASQVGARADADPERALAHDPRPTVRWMAAA